MKIGERIKEVRKNAKLTQKELAEKCNMSRSYIADLERDRYNPSIDTLQTIANALNISVSTFFNEEKHEMYLNMYSSIINSLRKEKNLSTDELDRVLNLPNNTINNIENNITNLSDDILGKLCDFFNVQKDYILGKTSERHPGEIDNLDKDLKLALNKLKKISPENRAKVLKILELFDDDKNI